MEEYEFFKRKREKENKRREEEKENCKKSNKMVEGRQRRLRT